MAAQKKINRFIQIGLSHGEKAKTLAGRGLYGEALEELDIALEAFSSQNEEGLWDDSVASILNNIGILCLFLHKYEEAAGAFKEALGIKCNSENDDNILGTLIGLSDAYAGLGEYEAAVDSLEDAFDLSLIGKDHGLALKVIEQYDRLCRGLGGLPDTGYGEDGADQVYMVPELFVQQAVIRELNITVVSSDEITMDMVIGLPGLKHDIEKLTSRWTPDQIIRDARDELPPLLLLLSPSTIEPVNYNVIDEEESIVRSVVRTFNGYVFSPGSYHRSGPQPLPAGSCFRYYSGNGLLYCWEPMANGWYRLNITCKIIAPEDTAELNIVFPFSSTRISKMYIRQSIQPCFKSIKIMNGSPAETCHAGELHLEHGQTIFKPSSTIYEGDTGGESDFLGMTLSTCGIISVILKK